MSAPLKLTAADLQRLAGFLEAVTNASTEFDVTFAASGPTGVQVSEGAILAVSWENSEYVVDDYNGN